MQAKPAVSLVVDEKWEKKVWALLHNQYGMSQLPGSRLLRSGRKRIRIISEDAFQLIHQVQCAGPAGLYFGEYRPQVVRPSMDGAQLIGPYATKGVVTITQEQSHRWLQGEPVHVQDEQRGYVIVSDGRRFLGCGSLSKGTLLSFVPKVRRPLKE
jgi:NOL1/NOP2/fmu family ribosome biogenesis protein